MLEIVAAFNGTAVPNLLMALGALMLMLCIVERRTAAVLGGLFVLLGLGISLAPKSPDQSLAPATSALPGPPRESKISLPATAVPATGPIRNGTREGSKTAARETAGRIGDPTGCTAKFTDLELDLSAGSEGESVTTPSEDVLYEGFLTNLMPSAELLPCATRHFSSRPLSPRAVATNGGRPEADALRMLAGGRFAGLERTYGSECSGSLRKDEVPLVRVQVLRFQSVAAAKDWKDLRWEAAADAMQVSELAESRTVWLRRSCGSVSAAVFSEEDSAGNVFIKITFYAAAENLGDPIFEKYSRLILKDIINKI